MYINTRGATTLKHMFAAKRPEQIGDRVMIDFWEKVEPPKLMFCRSAVILELKKCLE